jgi:hypothetical protein
MYCPSCGTENSAEDTKFCRSCGVDLRVVSQALSKSLPVRVASAVDAYLENRYQQNLRNGVLNVVAFVFLVVVGTVHLFSGWTWFGVFLLVLSVIAIVSGVWDIWIYKRNLPPIAKKTAISQSAKSTEELSPALNGIPSVTESTTRHLEGASGDPNGK